MVWFQCSPDYDEERIMELIEPEEMRRFSEILLLRTPDPADFEMRQTDVTDPGSDELLPMKGYVEISRKSKALCREYPTGDGSVWVAAFERDLLRGWFG
jgi:hypothetical protein